MEIGPVGGFLALCRINSGISIHAPENVQQSCDGKDGQELKGGHRGMEGMSPVRYSMLPFFQNSKVGSQCSAVQVNSQ